MKTENYMNDLDRLLEQFDFNELTSEQKRLVLKDMTEKEYGQLRNTVLASKEIFATADEYEPKAFLIPSKKSILLAPIPLYKALVGIAAAVLLMLLVFPSNQMNLDQQTVKYVTLYDTIETEKYVYDTVERIIQKPVVKEKIVYVNQPTNIATIQDSRRLLDVPVVPVYLSLSPSALQNKGTSLKDDTVKFNLPTIY